MRVVIRNTFRKEMRFYLEPEGQDFTIPPKEEAVLELSGDDPVGCLDIGLDGEGVRCASFWPDKGSYRVFVQGKDAWQLILEKGSGEIYT